MVLKVALNEGRNLLVLLQLLQPPKEGPCCHHTPYLPLQTNGAEGLGLTGRVKRSR